MRKWFSGGYQGVKSSLPGRGNEAERMANTKSWPCESVCSVWGHQTVWGHKDGRADGSQCDGEKAAELRRRALTEPRLGPW